MGIILSQSDHPVVKPQHRQPPQGRGRIHITTQTQQSHSSSPQSQPKQGFDTVLMGFLMMDDEPEDDEGRVKLIGEEMEDGAIVYCVYSIE